MNKQQLIEAIANEVDVTKATAAACLDAFINTVTKVLKKKGDVRLVGFGTFTTARPPQVATHRRVMRLKFRHQPSRNLNLARR